MPLASPPTALLVLTNSDWFGLARAPKVLANAGFRVQVFGPSRHAIMRSRFVDQSLGCDMPIDLEHFLARLADIIVADHPALILPGDDQTCALLHHLHQRAPADSPLKTVLDATLTPSQNHSILEQKSRQTILAHELGVLVPPAIINPDREAALAFAAKRGYPVMLKRDYTWAGRGVTLCKDEASLIAALDQIPTRSQLGRAVNRTLQAYISGTGAMVNYAAHRGTLLDSFAMTKLVQTGFGPTTVAMTLDDDQVVKGAARTLIEALSITGIGDVEFQIDAKTCQAFFIEMNPRWVPMAHLGQRLGHDLLGALAEKYGATRPMRHHRIAPIAGPIALFPNEQLRDPQSPYLENAFHDVPLDEPELFAELLNY